MNIKKELIFILVVLLLSLQGINFLLINTVPLLTGGATESTRGDVDFCLDKPPTITSIGAQTATSGTVFSLQVLATDTGDDDSLTFSDNTSLFAISSSGAISFTPTAADVGANPILITVEDNAGCLGYNVTDTFTLTISAGTGGGDTGGTGGSAGGGGGGGGGGSGGASAAGAVSTELSLTPEHSEEAALTSGESVSFGFGGMHSVNVLEVGKNFATVLVSSTPQKVILFLEKLQKIDVDGDAVFDIELELLSINGKEINLKTTLLRKGFILSDPLVRARVRQSQPFEKKIAVTSDWGGDLSITLDYPFDLMQVSPEELTLKKDEEKLITLLLNPYNAAPEIYTKTLTLTAREGKTTIIHSIPILLEVTSDEVLLDLSLDLRKKSLIPGEQLEALVSIFNPRKVPLDNVSLLYSIQDFQNNKLHQEEEIISLEEQVSLSKSISLPADIPAGEYALSLRVVHQDTVATAAEHFSIESVTPASPTEKFTAFFASKPFFLIALPFLIVAVLIILVLSRPSKPSEVKTIVKRIIVQQKLPAQREDLKNLQKKLSLIEDGFKRGYISREAYEKTKTKIEQLLKKA
ncbi:hypothetical protein HYX13_00200 [Candidatus Woesearchaeota archaeon]|nr:hypothetical protein [Candidatus Woesearchaeota archaeon]